MNAEQSWIRNEEQGILPESVAQVLSNRWNRFEVDPVEYLEARHCLEYAEPQAYWINGCPLGNGDLGVLAYGPPEATTFSFGKTDLWDYTPMPGPNVPAASFAELREICAAQDNVRFRELTFADAAGYFDSFPVSITEGPFAAGYVDGRM